MLITNSLKLVNNYTLAIDELFKIKKIPFLKFYETNVKSSLTV